MRRGYGAVVVGVLSVVELSPEAFAGFPITCFASRTGWAAGVDGVVLVEVVGVVVVPEPAEALFGWQARTWTLTQSPSSKSSRSAWPRRLNLVFASTLMLTLSPTYLRPWLFACLTSSSNVPSAGAAEGLAPAAGAAAAAPEPANSPFRTNDTVGLQAAVVPSFFFLPLPLPGPELVVDVDVDADVEPLFLPLPGGGPFATATDVTTPAAKRKVITSAFSFKEVCLSGGGVSPD